MLQTLGVRYRQKERVPHLSVISPESIIHTTYYCSGSTMFLYFYRNNLTRLLCWKVFLFLSVFLMVFPTTEDESPIPPTNLTTKYFAFGSIFPVTTTNEENPIKTIWCESRAHKTKRNREKYVQYLYPNL